MHPKSTLRWIQWLGFNQGSETPLSMEYMMLSGTRVSSSKFINILKDQINENLILTCAPTGNIYLWDFASTTREKPI